MEETGFNLKIVWRGVGEERRVISVPNEYIQQYIDQIVIPKHRKGNFS
jgi:hypothetical protein